MHEYTTCVQAAAKPRQDSLEELAVMSWEANQSLRKEPGAISPALKGLFIVSSVNN